MTMSTYRAIKIIESDCLYNVKSVMNTTVFYEYYLSLIGNKILWLETPSMRFHSVNIVQSLRLDLSLIAVVDLSQVLKYSTCVWCYICI